MSYDSQNSHQGEYTVHYQPRKYHRDSPPQNDVSHGVFPSTNFGTPFRNESPVNAHFPGQDLANQFNGQALYPMMGPPQMPMHGRTPSGGYHHSYSQAFSMNDFLPALSDVHGAYPSQPSPGSEAEDSDELFSSPARPIQFPPHEETEAYLRQNLNIMPPRPVDLSALPDEPFPDKTPKISTLIKLAIWGSKHKRLTLNQIYAEIENRYPITYKNVKDKPWQRSIRHNLSLKAIFVHQERPVSHPGKGHYWMLDYRQGEGNKRDRKRMQNARSGGMSDDSDSDLATPNSRPYRGPSVTNPPPHVPLGLPTSIPGPGAFYHSDSAFNVTQPALELRHPMEHTNLRPGPPPSVGPNMRWDSSMTYTVDPTQLTQGVPHPGYGNSSPMNDPHARTRHTTGNPYPVGPSYTSLPPRLPGASDTPPPSRSRRAHSDTFSEQDVAEASKGSRRQRTH